METHKTITVSYLSDGVAATTTMLEAQVGTRGPASDRRWYRCYNCAFDFPEDQVELINDVPWCIPRKCNLDGRVIGGK